MRTAKIALSLDEKVLARLDHLVKKHVFPNRSKAIQAAVQEKIAQVEHRRLARECAKLDPVFEKAMAEEGFSAELAR
ncbi:MAG: ribbon-helix-helix protein, CopG family [Nitrospinae bacterium]|nr:ribbon-helix-helix protein, CopG family [Nitrospinota bacterium]